MSVGSRPQEAVMERGSLGHKPAKKLGRGKLRLWRRMQWLLALPSWGGASSMTCGERWAWMKNSAPEPVPQLCVAWY